jgi:hypothetical protein
MTRKQPVSRVRATYQQANEQAAHIVLQDVAKYGGEQAALVQWARLVIEKQTATIKGPLFDKAA